MSTITQGVLGGFSGKTGPVIGSSWKGRPVMRARPVYKKNRKFSQPQLDQQEKFRLISTFLHGADELLNTSFKSSNKQLSGANAALAYNLREAITGLESPYSIDYAMIRLAQGPLVMATRPVVEPLADSQVKLSWTYTPDIAKTKPSDIAIAVLYGDTSKQFQFTSAASAIRSDGELTLDAPAYAGETVHVWFFFLSEDEGKACNSAYLGTVAVTD